MATLADDSELLKVFSTNRMLDSLAVPSLTPKRMLGYIVERRQADDSKREDHFRPDRR